MIAITKPALAEPLLESRPWFCGFLGAAASDSTLL
jgi:hypothetical protein